MATQFTKPQYHKQYKFAVSELAKAMLMKKQIDEAEQAEYRKSAGIANETNLGFCNAPHGLDEEIAIDVAAEMDKLETLAAVNAVAGD